MKSSVCHVTQDVTTDTVATKIARKVAETKDTDPLSLAPLFYSIEPDALQTLIDESNTDVSIQFEYEGCTVVVNGTGHVFVDD